MGSTLLIIVRFQKIVNTLQKWIVIHFMNNYSM
jgi:hypothetical protein